MTSLTRQRTHAFPSSRPPLPEGQAIRTLSVSQVHRMQKLRGEAPCFRTDVRYTCQQADCPLKPECHRRRAAWLR